MRRYLPIAVVFGLVLLIGATTVAMTTAAARTTEATLEDGRMALERTVASVVTQGLMTGSALSVTSASMLAWTFEPASAQDIRLLERYVRESPLFDRGAVLLDLAGNELNRWSDGVALPPADPGLLAELRAGPRQDPVFTSPIRVGDDLLLGMVVPVMANTAAPPRGVIIGYFALHGSLLQRYTDPIPQGPTGVAHIVRDGVVVTSTDPARVGQELPAGALRDLVEGDEPAFRELRDPEGTLIVASFAPTAVPGWGSYTTQASEEFYGPVRRGRNRIQLGILAVLLVAGPALGSLFHKRQEAMALATYQATHDALTGLPNRQQFSAKLEDAFAANAGGLPGVAVLFCDLDGFKAVNDTLGHAAGDALLVAVARRLTASTRDAEIIARVGGDEFTILIRDATPCTVARIADRIVEAFDAPVQLAHDVPRQHVGISIGAALTDGVEVTTAEELLQAADLAMYEGKAQPGSAWQAAPCLRRAITGAGAVAVAGTPAS